MPKTKDEKLYTLKAKPYEHINPTDSKTDGMIPIGLQEQEENNICEDNSSEHFIIGTVRANNQPSCPNIENLAHNCPESSSSLSSCPPSSEVLNSNPGLGKLTITKNYAECRIKRDIQELSLNKLPGITWEPDPIMDDIFKWIILITAPDDSTNRGKVFEGVMEFTSEYPYVPPTLTFSKKISHPYITKLGIFRSYDHERAWTPYFTLTAFLMMVQYTLGEMEPELMKCRAILGRITNS